MANQFHDQRIPLPEKTLSKERPFYACENEDACLTCSDEALPARVVSIGDETGMALVEIGGTTAEIDVSLVDAIAPGDWLLTHGGVAIGRLEEGYAAEVGS
jgi:hydrogenase assembly chaperone HypC/HupF